MRPFQLLLSPPAAERGVGVARAAKQEKIEPVSNRPRARRGAVGRSGGRSHKGHYLSQIALGSETFYLPLPPPPPALAAPSAVSFQ